MKKISAIGVLAFVVAFSGVSSVSAAVGYGGGGGGSTSGSRRVVVTPVVAPAGKVLGASTFAFTSHLRKGASSDAVKQLQERLRSEGFFTYATSTGYFGPITLEAVKAYQTKHGIPSTGFVGPLTIAELNK
ncbi:MAG: peptidoglycan-binding domain-containing protein [bacterium]